MEKFPTKFSIRIFKLLSIVMCFSILWQIAVVTYVQSKGPVIVTPLQWYVWAILIFGSLWVLYFAVIIFESNISMKLSLLILGICLTLILLNAWLLLGSPILWVCSVAAISVLLVMAWRLFRSAKLGNEGDGGRIKESLVVRFTIDKEFLGYVKKCRKVFGWQKWHFIYFITTKNLEKRLAFLNIPAEIKNEIKKEVSNGKIIIISEAPFRVDNWVGNKYLVMD